MLAAQSIATMRIKDSRPTRFIRSLWPGSAFALEVISGVRLVEGVMGERKVGNDVLEQCVGERAPVEEGRVHDLDPEELARAVHYHPVNDRAAPSLHEPECGLEGRHTAQRRCQRSPGQPLDGLATQPCPLSGLFDPHEAPGFDVTRFEDRHPTLQVSRGRAAMITPDVAANARAAR